MRGQAALNKLREERFHSVLDIGSGAGDHAKTFREMGRKVTTISLEPPADVVGDYMWHDFSTRFDCIWASHVLEHQPCPGSFLKKVYGDLRPGGLLAITVPPLKHQIVGGHVSLWNAGLLLYHLILAGFDCSMAAVKSEGYDISVILRKSRAHLPKLRMDSGDINTLAHFFPMAVSENFNGCITEVNWNGSNR